jgi:hypothetical protein
MRAITQCARISRQVRFPPQSKQNNRNTRSKSPGLFDRVYLLFGGIPPNVRASPVICAHSTPHTKPDRAT